MHQIDAVLAVRRGFSGKKAPLVTGRPHQPGEARMSTEVPGRLCSQSSSFFSTRPLAVCGLRGEFSFSVPLALP